MRALEAGSYTNLDRNSHFSRNLPATGTYVRREQNMSSCATLLGETATQRSFSLPSASAHWCEMQGTRPVI